ncbi:glycerophosphodiester phosphodiesterase [Neobacillus sp. MM2021_6]|uniref:glycerophosphodiester phosphodiesterase n=1 Tax=Bacillaceae TaxID=186817 RepID=UPI00140A0E7E|nr:MULTISPECIES: glycerophosphodiester phosphodiesterase [Bacillaceae]MBO0960814.1 glycerophosphodiester phosphodiesterase [Neobacillus sp. MM2021_6]NHC17062.1 glycerophosphodiester phosphodiesterase [Bacillus sp. MM2020_4]
MTQIFAHRGYSASNAENTMAAFWEAEKAGADGIELDVQLTKDGEIVVIHDEKVDRTTSGNGFVKDFLYKEIRKLNANKKGVKKEPIPSLTEVLEWMKTNKLICNIELKNGLIPYEGMEDKVIELIRKYSLTDRVILSSFNHYSIVYSYRIAPEIETAPLFIEGIYMPWIYSQSIRAKGIHPKHSAMSDNIIIHTMENGIAVRPYTVNKEADMNRLFNINCTAIITDDPAKALRIRKQYEKRP